MPAGSTLRCWLHLSRKKGGKNTPTWQCAKKKSASVTCWKHRPGLLFLLPVGSSSWMSENVDSCDFICSSFKLWAILYKRFKKGKTQQMLKQRERHECTWGAIKRHHQGEHTHKHMQILEKCNGPCGLQWKLVQHVQKIRKASCLDYCYYSNSFPVLLQKAASPPRSYWECGILFEILPEPWSQTFQLCVERDSSLLLLMDWKMSGSSLATPVNSRAFCFI